jgi:hypothetical protein
MSCAHARKILEFDDSLAPCEIPAGTWPMKDVMWAGFGPRPGVPRTIVNILSGAEFTDLRMIGGQITIVNHATGNAHSPVSDFGSGDHVQIGMRDDCGNTQIVNQGNVPMFDLKDKSAYFFVQNCLFGMSIAGLESHPLIRHTVDSAGCVRVDDIPTDGRWGRERNGSTGNRVRSISAGTDREPSTPSVIPP